MSKYELLIKAVTIQGLSYGHDGKITIRLAGRTSESEEPTPAPKSSASSTTSTPQSSATTDSSSPSSPSTPHATTNAKTTEPSKPAVQSFMMC